MPAENHTPNNAPNSDVCEGDASKCSSKTEDAVKEIIEIEEVEDVEDSAEVMAVEPIVLEDDKDSTKEDDGEPIILSNEDVVVEAELVETIPEPVPQPQIIEVEELDDNQSSTTAQ